MESYSSWGQMFVGKQIFAGSWGRYFLGMQKNATREDKLYMCPWFVYRLRIELSFLYFIRKDNSIWFGFKLQNRVIFLVDTSLHPVIVVKWHHRFQARLTAKTMIAIKHFSLLLVLVEINKGLKKYFLSFCFYLSQLCQKAVTVLCV